MATTKNKVKYGLKNVHYAKLTFADDGTPTFETPKRIPGAVNLSTSKDGENVEFYADDGVYFEENDNSSLSGDMELALIPDDFRTDILGTDKDDKGVLTDYAVQELGHFALLFEFSADKKAVRHVLYNCTASQSELSGATRGQSLEVQTETLNIRARPLPKDGRVKARTGDDTDATTYDGWYTKVFLPGASGE